MILYYMSICSYIFYLNNIYIRIVLLHENFSVRFAIPTIGGTSIGLPLNFRTERELKLLKRSNTIFINSLYMITEFIKTKMDYM